MSHPLDGSYAKLGRAEEHLETLQRDVAVWLDGKPYPVEANFNTETGECLLRVRVTKEPPIDWGLLVGEIVHNWRAALDHLVYQLTLRRVGRGLPRTEFPVFDDPTSFRRRTKKGKADMTSGFYKLRGLRPVDIAVIERLQPYGTGKQFVHSHPLGILHDLDVVDKHRTLNLVGHGVGTFGLGISVLDGYDLWIDYVTSHRPLKDRTMVGRLVLTPRKPNAKVEMRPELTTEIQFGKGSARVEGAPLLSTLLGIQCFMEEWVFNEYWERVFAS